MICFGASFTFEGVLEHLVAEVVIHLVLPVEARFARLQERRIKMLLQTCGAMQDPFGDYLGKVATLREYNSSYLNYTIYIQREYL